MLLAVVVLLGWLPMRGQLLWRITGGALDRPSYLCGTYHLAPASFIDSIQGLRQVIPLVDEVVGEINRDSLLSKPAQQRMALAMMAPADSTLDRLVSPEGYRIIEKVFNKYYGSFGIGLETFNGLKPAAIALQIELLQSAEEQEILPSGASNVLDIAIQDVARNAGRKFAGLESVDDQIALLFGASLRDQAASLLEMCQHDDDHVGTTVSIYGTYCKQDVEALYRLTTDPSTGMTPAELQRMVVDRNVAWVSTLQQWMPHRSLLVAVGAGHLGGPQGMIALLREKGYTVEPCMRVP